MNIGHNYAITLGSDGNWYKFDDAQIIKLNTNIEAHIVNSNAYALFYEKMSNPIEVVEEYFVNQPTNDDQVLEPTPSVIEEYITSTINETISLELIHSPIDKLNKKKIKIKPFQLITNLFKKNL